MLFLDMMTKEKLDIIWNGMILQTCQKNLIRKAYLFLKPAFHYLTFFDDLDGFN